MSKPIILNHILQNANCSYTISLHDWPVPHADFFIIEETKLPLCKSDEHVLITWRLNHFTVPNKNSERVQQTAELLPPHRLIYLDYSGPVSGQRGNVEVWDQGQAKINLWNDSQIKIQLTGRNYSGILTLIKSESAVWKYDFS